MCFSGVILVTICVVQDEVARHRIAKESGVGVGLFVAISAPAAVPAAPLSWPKPQAWCRLKLQEPLSF